LNFGLNALLRRILLLISILAVVDLCIGIFFGLFVSWMPLNPYSIGLFSVVPIGYFSNKSFTRIASDLAFFEGAAIFFAGALLAFYRSSLSSTTKILMIIGAAMIGLSIFFGVLS
jgi:hypothetical protein